MGSQVCVGEGTNTKSGAWMKDWMCVMFIFLCGSDPHEGWVLGGKGVSGRGGRGAEGLGGVDREDAMYYRRVYICIYTCVYMPCIPI